MNYRKKGYLGSVILLVGIAVAVILPFPYNVPMLIIGIIIIIKANSQRKLYNQSFYPNGEIEDTDPNLPHVNKNARGENKFEGLDFGSQSKDSVKWDDRDKDKDEYGQDR